MFCTLRECAQTQSAKWVNPLCKSKVVKVIYYNYFYCQLFHIAQIQQHTHLDRGEDLDIIPTTY